MILPVVGGGQDDPFPVTGEYEGSEPVLASSRPDGSQTPASTPRSGRDRSGHHSLIFFSHPAWVRIPMVFVHSFRLVPYTDSGVFVHPGDD